MISDMNFLLVGNSRLHWAEYCQNKYRYFHTKKNYQVSQNFNFNNLFWASVGKLPNFLLKEENEIKTNDIKLKNLPDFFGVDRALACLAALHIVENPLKKDLLIADFGTVLSLTKIKANGFILGGQLAPGFLTQLKAIDQNTKNLVVPKKFEFPTEDFLMETEDAILKGVLNSITGLIKNSFNPIKDILITCGGDSQFITKILKSNNGNIIYSPNLVMEGMIIHLRSQKNLR